MSAPGGLKSPGTETPTVVSEQGGTAMRANNVYLEAPSRTQDLLNIKWALRSAGYCIVSTWHEAKGPVLIQDHWNATALEQLRNCDLLVVVGATNETIAPELAMMAGFALARGVPVCWIGPAIRALCDFRVVQRFNTAEEFRKQIISRAGHEAASAGYRLVA